VPRISKAREAAIRARILHAGIDAFERNGFRRASMSTIASAAGLSSGAIYTYFESKEELFLRAFAHVVAEEEQAMVAAIGAEPSTRQRIRIAIDYFVDAGVAPAGDGIRGAGGGILVHAWANAADSAPIREQLLERRRQLEGLARLVIDDAVARGELPAQTDAPGLAGAMGSLLDGLIVQRAEMGERFGRNEARRQAYAVVDAVLGRDEADPEPGPGRVAGR
jgi:AcrR family transcriptional regulator